MDKLKALIFDIDGVILDHKTNNEYLWLRNIKNDFGVPADVIKELHYDKDSWKLLSLGRLSLKDYFTIFLAKKRINTITSKQLVKYLITHDNNIRQYMLDEVDKIRKLKKYKICIGTHQEPNKGMFLWNHEKLKLHFDYFFSSYIIGHLKTEKEFYSKIGDILKLDPSEIMLIDDNQDNLKVAKECGWNTYLYTTFDDIKSNLFEKLGD